MQRRDEILQCLREIKPRLQQRYPLSELALFGSYARGDEQPESDIDILVAFEGTIDGFRYVEMAHELQNLFSEKVDIVSRRAIRSHYLPYVEKNIIHV